MITVIGSLARAVLAALAVHKFLERRRRKRTADVRFLVDRAGRRVYLENQGGADAIHVDLSEPHGTSRTRDPLQPARKHLPAKRIKADGGTYPLPVLHELIRYEGVGYVITWHTDAGKEGSYRDVLYPLA